MTTPRVTVPVEPIQRLILAADSYGVRYLDSDDMSAEAEELQAATEAMKDLIAAPAPEGGAAPFDRDALIALIMEETTDDIVADGRDRLGKPNVLVQGCRYIRRNAPPSPEGYANPEASAKQFAGFIADRVLKALATREEAPADNVTILITRAQRDAALNSGKKLDDWIGGILQRAVEEAPAEAVEVREVEAWIKRALIYIDQCVGAGEIHFPGIEDDPADLAAEGFALFGLEDDCDAAAIPTAALRAQPPAREVPVVNIKCEADVGTAIGTTRLNVVRVEQEDDGSFTAVTDYWPQAREDAHPVAWRYRFVTSTDGKDWSDWFLVDGRTYIPTRENQTIQPLYTHPAPDALRVAVEALEPFASVDTSGWSDEAPVDEMDGLTAQHLRCAAKAYAALQAEQKGGAA